MLPTYSAILRNGQLEWGKEGAPPVSPNQSVPVQVTLLGAESLSLGNGPAMASALAAIAATDGAKGITDPVEWQRESRADHPLPGRTE